MSEENKHVSDPHAGSELPDIDSLWNYDDPPASEMAFRKVLPAAETSGDVDYRAQLLTQIARSQILQRRIDDGHATLDEVNSMLSDRTPTARVRCLLERGRAWNDSGRRTEAIAAFAEAFALASAAKLDMHAVDAVHMLGVMPPDDIAAIWNHRGIEIAERSDDPHARRWIGTLYMNLGVAYQRLTQYSDAERAFTSSIFAFEQTANVARVRLGRLCLSKNMRLRGDADNALRLDLQLLEEIQAAQEP